MNEVIFSGGSHYGVSALKSIQKHFDIVYLMSSNPIDILNLKREKDLVINNFNESDCKFVFLAGHESFINSRQLNQKTFINFHGSLLPRWRGMHPTFWAIFNGDKRLGVTYHIVDQYMDSGPILKKISYKFNGQSNKEINAIISNLAYENSGKVLKGYIQGKIIPRTQNSDKATYGVRRNLNDCFVNFDHDNKLLERFFIALTPPYPLPRLEIKSKTYEILDYKLIKRKYYSSNGRVVNIDNNGVWIRTKEGFLIVKYVCKSESNETELLSSLVRIGHRF